jgi:hypothetical protein
MTEESNKQLRANKAPQARTHKCLNAFIRNYARERYHAHNVSATNNDSTATRHIDQHTKFIKLAKIKS